MIKSHYHGIVTSEVSFQSSSGFLLSQLGVLASRSWFELLAQRRLTPHHHSVLLTLHATGPLALTALAHATLVDARNMGAVLEPLEQRNLLQRKDDPSDRRRRLVTLTPAGTSIAAELAGAAGAIEDELLAPLDASQREILRQHLLTLWMHAKNSPSSHERPPTR